MNDQKPIIRINKLQKKTLTQIHNLIKKGIYQYEKVKCCICNGNNFQLISEKDRHGFEYQVVICENCGLIQNNPRLNQASYFHFYKNLYRKLILGENIPTEKFFQKEKIRGKKILSFLETCGVFKNINKNRFFIFEVGCGAGGVLKVFKDEHFKVSGCDLNKEYLEYGNKYYDLNLIQGTLDEIKFDEKPDLIIYSHVLEHILYPYRELKNIFNKLKNNSFLYIEVPGVKTIDLFYQYNFLEFLHLHHVYYFTKSSLKNLISKTDFQIVKINEMINCLCQKIRNTKKKPPKITNDFKPTLSYLKDIENKRKRYLTIKAAKILFIFLKIINKN
jgi:2-polyprenyl-3-methyl-5-hydroxy-6-metoxy-1,4-benzoquinol methylase